MLGLTTDGLRDQDYRFMFYFGVSGIVARVEDEKTDLFSYLFL